MNDDDNNIILATKQYCKDNFAAKPELELKQDKLTAGENIKIENNVISASGGGSSNENGLQPGDQVIWDIVPASEPLQTFAPTPYALDLEININTAFPVAGRMEITHIIVPRLLVDKSGYYIGYSKKKCGWCL